MEVNNQSFNLSQRRASMVDRLSTRVEWPQLSPPTIRPGHVHRRLRPSLGDSPRLANLRRLLDKGGIISPHQRQRAISSRTRSASSRGPGQDSQHHLRQHNNHLLSESIWRLKIAPAEGDSNSNLAILPDKGTRIRTTYVPSTLNPADAPSRRMNTQLEWSISHDFFQSLNQKWGPHQIDLFASHLNNKLPTFYSWKPHHQAASHDALSRPWTNLGNQYLCPPWNLISTALQKIQDEGLTATIITPFWPTAFWYPTIQQMATTAPVPVPWSAVRPAPGDSSTLLERNPHWSMTAWRVNGTK